MLKGSDFVCGAENRYEHSCTSTRSVQTVIKIIPGKATFLTYFSESKDESSQTRSL
ncbi:hypothetical protein GCK32_009797 [Trichostrongylus colubriformis]|uniref:Uncharacterized protein n=1 Tax=Trichostrongylus colubriformis TaxID=6319 RepID=A0AAN8IUJ5_TRICO